jgi:hypothetical protein
MELKPLQKLAAYEEYDSWEDSEGHQSGPSPTQNGQAPILRQHPDDIQSRIRSTIDDKNSAGIGLREALSQLALHASPATLGHLINAIHAIEAEVNELLKSVQ